MTKHLHRDMDQVHRQILSLSATVEEMIDKAGLVLTQRRYEVVDEIVEQDKAVDQQEVLIEEECLKMLALHQPVAGDLRRIVTVLKVNNDMERIADLAVNIAERARSVSEYPEFGIPDKLDSMVSKAMQMVRGSLDAFVNLDQEAARTLLAMDDEVDELNIQIIEQLQNAMQENANLVVPALHCFSATRHLERIGDLATNIAEDVIYLIEGEIIRHQQISRELSS